MNKILIAISMLVMMLANPVFAWQERAPLPLTQCEIQSPFGFPQTNVKLDPICREAYLSGYDPANKVPMFVLDTLTPQHALGCVERSNAFQPDQSVPNGPTPQDYAGTGYDKGHMDPDGDQSYNQQVEYESFLMTNMTPQAPSFNRGIWKLLETSVRGWAVQHNQNFTVYAGAVYNNADKRIGHGVIVPHAFYKIVIDDATGEVAGWWFPHVAPYPNLGNDLTKFRTPIATIEQRAGVKFAFPKNAKELAPGKEWSVDYGKLTVAKRQLCHHS